MRNPVIQDIHDKFQLYLDIYNNEYETLSDESRILLENSIYLSIFTIFEDFLKLTIDNFILIKKDSINFSDINNKIGEEIMFGLEGRLLRKKNDFDSLINTMNKPLSENSLKKVYKFKFLHKGVVEEHYNLLFEDIIGDEFYFNRLKLVLDEKSEDLENRQTIRASKFLENFTLNIRNSIAHQNHRFKRTVNDYSIETTTYLFLQIIEEISEKFLLKNNVELKFYEEHEARNLLEI